MNSATIGIPAGSPGYYNELVYDAVQFTASGTYIHSAPWSVGEQGMVNVSHGCVNVGGANAVWYYDHSMLGDPVSVVGSPVRGTWDNGWTIYFLSWHKLLSGSATGDAVLASASGSQFVPLHPRWHRPTRRPPGAGHPALPRPSCALSPGCPPASAARAEGRLAGLTGGHRGPFRLVGGRCRGRCHARRRWAPGPAGDHPAQRQPGPADRATGGGCGHLVVAVRRCGQFGHRARGEQHGPLLGRHRRVPLDELALRGHLDDPGLVAVRQRLRVLALQAEADAPGHPVGEDRPHEDREPGVSVDEVQREVQVVRDDVVATLQPADAVEGDPGHADRGPGRQFRGRS